MFDAAHVPPGVIDVAKLAQGLRPRALWRHSVGHEIGDAGIEMKLDFGVHVVTTIVGHARARAAGHEDSTSKTAAAYRRHADSLARSRCRPFTVSR